MVHSQYLHVSTYKGYIHVECMSSRSAAQLQRASAAITFFRRYGHKVKVMVLDNEAHADLLSFFRQQLIGFQKVPPFSKRTNRAERAIQTFPPVQPHPNLPINHWQQLIPQSEMTLNMMRSYADHRASSAYHGILRHHHDFAAHPLLPSGILAAPSSRSSIPHGIVLCRTPASISSDGHSMKGPLARAQSSKPTPTLMTTA
jgi:hypothetical protein